MFSFAFEQLWAELYSKFATFDVFEIGIAFNRIDNDSLAFLSRLQSNHVCTMRSLFLLVNVVEIQNKNEATTITKQLIKKKYKIDSAVRLILLEIVFFSSRVCVYLFVCFGVARIFWEEANSSAFHIILEIGIKARNRQSVRCYTVVPYSTLSHTFTANDKARNGRETEIHTRSYACMYTQQHAKLTYTERERER